MDLYTMTLKSIGVLLAEIGKDEYIPVVDDCISKWEQDNNCDIFRHEFEKKGRFADFRIDSRTAETPEKGFWSAQVFTALIAMAAQLADFRKKGLKDDLDYLKRNFGAANEVMVTGKCSSCGYREATASDIDRYVSRIVIAKRVMGGLEKGNLEEEVKALVNVTCPDIARERRKTILRLDNTGIPHDNKYGKLAVCPSCGGEKIIEGRLLRSLKENVFIRLNK